MAVVNGTVKEVQILRSNIKSPLYLQWALVLFEVTSGTYAQADNLQISNVHTAISGSTRNGKTVTLVDAMFAQEASKSTDPTGYLGLKTVAVSGNNVTAEITLDSTSTEFTDATAVTGQASPFGILVSFVES